MNEVHNIFKHFGIGCLFLAVCIPFESRLMDNAFPVNHMSSLIQLTFLTILIFYYSYSLSCRIDLKRIMLTMAGMMYLLIFLRAVKYSVLPVLSIGARYVWYLYYVPLLMIPVLLYDLQVLVFSGEESFIPAKCKWVFAISVLLVIFVLTNDFHQQIFRFSPGFENWDGNYTYGWGFYVLSAWEYSLFIIAFILLVVKCRIRSSRRNSWFLLIPFIFGMAVILLLFTGNMPQLNGYTPIEFPEAYCFMMAGILECCIQLGIIPTNKNHKKIFEASSIAMRIVDKTGNTVYRSAEAPVLSPLQLALPNGARIDGNMRIGKLTLSGGTGIWLEDMSQLDRLNEELKETGERLSEEVELIRLQNELKKKREELVQRNALYDGIAANTLMYSDEIRRIAAFGLSIKDPEQRNLVRKHIVLIGSFIKRSANLMLLSENNPYINCEELSLSMSEVIHRLNLYGVPGEIISSASGVIRADAATAVFEAFGVLLQNNLHVLKGVFVHLSGKDGSVLCKLILEKAEKLIPETLNERLTASGIRMDAEFEDQTAYISLITGKEGGKT